jgi:cytochrome c-type biogenesis protein
MGMLPEGLEAAIGTGSPWALGLTMLAGMFVGLAPAAYLAGPAVLAYMTVGAKGNRGALLWRALAYVVGAAVPMATIGLLLGAVGELVIGLAAELLIVWYLLVALVTGISGVLMTGLVVAKVPAYLPLPRPVSSVPDAFLLGLPLGLAACPACTPMLFPIAAAATVSGGPLYGAGLLFLFGIGRGVPILLAAASLESLRQLRQLIPMGLAAQQIAGWLLLATSLLYLVQVGLVLSGQPAWFT